MSTLLQLLHYRPAPAHHPKPAEYVQITEEPVTVMWLPNPCSNHITENSNVITVMCSVPTLYE